MKNLILEHKQILFKIKRLSFEVEFQCLKYNKVLFIGVNENGLKLANELIKNLNKDKYQCMGININKSNFENDIPTHKSEIENFDKIIIVDDVIHSGKVAYYIISELNKLTKNEVSVLSLVDRVHRKYPVQAAFKGLELSTSFTDHISVDLSNDNQYQVFISYVEKVS